MKTYEEKINAIIEYFENNEETFNDCIEELDDYNGCLDSDRFFEMEMLDEFYCGVSATEILQRAFFGGDEDGGSEFNPNSSYFRYNGYGNLVSTNYKDYSDHLDHWVIEAMQENRRYISTIKDDEDLSALFDALDSDVNELETSFDEFCENQNCNTCKFKYCRTMTECRREFEADLNAASDEEAENNA